MQKCAPLHHFGRLQRCRLARLGRLHLVLEGVFAAVLVVLVGLLLRHGLVGQLDGSGRMVGGLSLDLDHLCLGALGSVYGVGGYRSDVSGAPGPGHRGGSVRSVVIVDLFFELFESLTIIVVVVIDDLGLSFPHSGRLERVVRHRLSNPLLNTQRPIAARPRLYAFFRVAGLDEFLVDGDESRLPLHSV